MPLIYFDPRFQEHQTGEHPECPARLQSIQTHLEKQGTLKQWTRKEVVSAKPAQLEAIHSKAYLQELEKRAAAGGGRIENDTVMSRRSWEVAQLAAGTVAAAVDEVFGGKERQAVCLIRPPGHHALSKGAMGFCLLNNVAIAAAHALNQHRLQRVLIVDWDVHHGNGTQDIFYESGRVFFFSVHRSPFYPGTGEAMETGTGEGLGTKFNLPLRFGVTRKSYLEQFETVLTQAAEKCKPELVLLSAGFDAHKADPIGSLGLETEDFELLTKLVQQVSKSHCGGKLVSLLEGGYNLQALAESVEIHLNALALG